MDLPRRPQEAWAWHDSEKAQNALKDKARLGTPENPKDRNTHMLAPRIYLCLCFIELAIWSLLDMNFTPD